MVRRVPNSTADAISKARRTLICSQKRVSTCRGHLDCGADTIRDTLHYVRSLEDHMPADIRHYVISTQPGSLVSLVLSY